MTVKELRDILTQFDDNMEVQIVDNYWCEPIDDVDDYDGVVLIRNIGQKKGDITMDTATILTTINYNDFTPMDMIYIIEELSEIHGRDKVKTTLKSIITLMEKYEKEH